MLTLAWSRFNNCKQPKKDGEKKKKRQERERRETDVHVGQSDDTEGLVDLPKVNLVSSDTSVLEGAGDGIRRGGVLVSGYNGGDGRPFGPVHMGDA